MSFIDKFTANVTNAGRVVSQKTKNFSEANTLANEKRTEQRNIQDTMAEIAKLYVEKYKDDPTAEFAEQIASIKASEKHIAQLETQIELVRAREPELIPVPQDVKEVKPQRTPTAMVCMNCGRSYAAGVNHCQNCGSELIPQHGNFKNGTPVEPEAAPQTTTENWYSEEKTDAPASEPIDLTKKEDAAPAENAVPEETAAPEAQAENTDTPRFCPYCGNRHEAGQAFCTNCGKKL